MLIYTYTAFEQFNLISQGTLKKVAIDVGMYLKKNKNSNVLIFSDLTGQQVDLDVKRSESDIMASLEIFESADAPVYKGPGRPKLGVKPREISLLPHQWEWLFNREGGSSAMIRKLIDEKIKSDSKTNEKIKNAQESTYKFLFALAGDLPSYEEAIRYLYRKDKDNFCQSMSLWPKSVSKHALKLSKVVFE